MPVVLQGNGGTNFDVDADRNARVVVRSPAIGALGAYAITMASGAIVATGGVGAIIATLQFTSGGNLCVIESVEVDAFVVSTITTAVPYDLSLFVCRTYTGASTTNATAQTITGNNQKRRTSFGTTLVNTLNILNTAAAGITAGTRTPDAQAHGRISGNSGTVVGTHFFGSNPAPLYRCDLMAGSYPIVLSGTNNEGIEIQAPLAGPATGTFQVNVTIRWFETTTF